MSPTPSMEGSSFEHPRLHYPQETYFNNQGYPDFSHTAGTIDTQQAQKNQEIGNGSLPASFCPPRQTLVNQTAFVGTHYGLPRCQTQQNLSNQAYKKNELQHTDSVNKASNHYARDLGDAEDSARKYIEMPNQQSLVMSTIEAGNVQGYTVSTNMSNGSLRPASVAPPNNQPPGAPTLSQYRSMRQSRIVSDQTTLDKFANPIRQEQMVREIVAAIKTTNFAEDSPQVVKHLKESSSANPWWAPHCLADCACGLLYEIANAQAGKGMDFLNHEHRKYKYDRYSTFEERYSATIQALRKKKLICKTTVDWDRSTQLAYGPSSSVEQMNRNKRVNANRDAEIQIAKEVKAFEKAQEEPSWSDLTVPNLRAALEERNLPKSGNKADLVARLENFDLDQEAPRLQGCWQNPDLNNPEYGPGDFERYSSGGFEHQEEGDFEYEKSKAQDGEETNLQYGDARYTHHMRRQIQNQQPSLEEYEGEAGSGFEGFVEGAQALKRRRLI